MPLLYVFTILFGLQFAVIHGLAEFFALYWLYPWFDIPMHICGGLLVMLILCTLSQMKVLPTWLSTSWRLPILLVLILLVWEGFGIYRYGGLKPDFWSDSMFDLIFGALGLILGHYFVLQLRRMQ